MLREAAFAAFLEKYKQPDGSLCVRLKEIETEWAHVIETLCDGKAEKDLSSVEWLIIKERGPELSIPF